MAAVIVVAPAGLAWKWQRVEQALVDREGNLSPERESHARLADLARLRLADQCS